eukprot:TRINITY_DN24112_c0_g1_i1.p1 TRINITY_DN24112_c0_g1~~TRINITY_DN24112_c0_g1_i1.p1  ORF type:complete len:227 (-),score=41.96 TRINITY_DN24112_c0_g1_i1:219-899(-)
MLVGQRVRQAAIAGARFFASCTRCGAEPMAGPDFFWCVECRQVPPSESAKSVTYFEALGLPLEFEVDMSAAKTQLGKLQKRFEELARAGEDVEALNAYVKRVGEAFHTLRVPLQRAEYLVKMHASGAREESGQLLPEVAELEEEAYSAEVEDVGKVARVIEQNNVSLMEAEAALIRAVESKQWQQACKSLQESEQRRALKRRLSDLVLENNEAATPAHSSTVGGVE